MRVEPADILRGHADAQGLRLRGAGQQRQRQ